MDNLVPQFCSADLLDIVKLIDQAGINLRIAQMSEVRETKDHNLQNARLNCHLALKRLREDFRWTSVDGQEFAS